ncbi:MAG: hypothetical protein SH850_08075 [Planctomycetaceae bacterium]|nr:hypothetical protein [Planctomycetaceae bacterium]
MSRIVFLLLSGALLMAAAGCGSNRRQWEITVENKSSSPCSFFITLAGNSGEKVDDVAQGKPIALIAGVQPTVVETVRIVCGSDEQTLTPNVGLPIGKRYAVVVAVDGIAQGSLSDR